MPQDHKAEITTQGSSICCIADLHIGVHQNSIYWHDTALSWAKWLAKELTEKKIKDIFILGDIFHYRDEIAVNTLHTVNEIFKLWKKFNIVLLVGNHDAYYKDRSDVNSISIFDERKNVTVISTTTAATLFGKEVLFVPWGESIETITNKDIIFGHFEIESFKMNSYKLCDTGTKTTDLLNKANLILTGHFHLREERDYNGKKIVYVGNPFEMDFGDTGSTKGYYLLDLNDLNLIFYENTFSPKHKKILLSELIQQNSTEKNNLKAAVDNNIVKLIVDTQATPDNIDALIKKISSYKPFSVSIDYKVNSNITITDDTNVDMSGIDIGKAIEEFVNMLDIQDKESIIGYCQELYKRCK
jgi:DNA repair exonuclease SbcCD nuclease subunit